jgi:hypothetical protein
MPHLGSHRVVRHPRGRTWAIRRHNHPFETQRKLLP